jgi:hypothetical protein
VGKFLQNLSLGRLGRRWKDNIKMSDMSGEGAEHCNAEPSRSVTRESEMSYPFVTVSITRHIFTPIFELL